jgi:hypothetical protein
MKTRGRGQPNEEEAHMALFIAELTSTPKALSL